MSIESEARGIQRRHHTDRANSGAIELVEFCVLCDHRWPCPDRLAADAITQALKHAIAHLEACSDETAGEVAWHHKQHAVAALASLTGQERGPYNDGKFV